jgi:hypothetical protein
MFNIPSNLIENTKEAIVKSACEYKIVGPIGAVIVTLLIYTVYGT